MRTSGRRPDPCYRTEVDDRKIRRHAMVMKGIALWTQRILTCLMLLILVVILVLGLFGGPAPPSLRKQLAGVGLGLIIICFALAMIAQATGSTVIERIAHGLLWILIIGGMVGLPIATITVMHQRQEWRQPYHAPDDQYPQEAVSYTLDDR